MNLFNGQYKGKHVLITGHTGFKGSWLMFWLKKLGAEVTGIALEPNTTPSHYTILDIPHKSYFIDINDRLRFRRAIHDIRPDFVFHMAAQPLVRLSYSEPLETFSTNVMGTANLLDACRDLPSLKGVVVVTSDKCYQNKGWSEGYKEDDPMGGRDPYSASKGCAELVTESFRHSYFNLDEYGSKHQVLVASVRAGNVIGGGDWATDRLIPDLVRAVVANHPLHIRFPYATRPWQHVLEPLSGYLALGAKLIEGKPAFAKGWNFGPAHESNIKVIELINQAKHIWESVTVEMEESDQLHEAAYLMLDSAMAKNELKWDPIWSFETTVERTIEWYRDYYTKTSINTELDFEQFISDAKNKSIEWAQG